MNPAFLVGLIANLDARTTAAPMNSPAGQQFSDDLMRNGLHQDVVAQILNGSGTWIAQLLSHLTPSVIASAVNGNQQFVTDMMTYMKPADMVDVINHNLIAQDTLVELVGDLQGSVIAQATNAHPEMMAAMLYPTVLPGGAHVGIDPSILEPILATEQCKNFLGPFLANMSQTGTRTLLTNTGNFIGNLLNRATGGISANTILQAIAGPTNSGSINPRTGTGYSPSQNVLRRTWMYGATQVIYVWTLPSMNGLVQIQDARLNTTAGEPLDNW